MKKNHSKILFIKKNENFSSKENIHSGEKWIIAQGYSAGSSNYFFTSSQPIFLWIITNIYSSSLKLHIVLLSTIGFTLSRFQAKDNKMSVDLIQVLKLTQTPAQHLPAYFMFLPLQMRIRGALKKDGKSWSFGPTRGGGI